MSVLDRIRRTDTDRKSGESLSSTRPSNPAFDRIVIVTEELTEFIQIKTAGSGYARFAWVAGSMMRELFDEMEDADVDADKITEMLTGFASLIGWCATGDSTDLLPDFRDYLRARHPELFPAEITAGTDYISPSYMGGPVSDE